MIRWEQRGPRTPRWLIKLSTASTTFWRFIQSSVYHKVLNMRLFSTSADCKHVRLLVVCLDVKFGRSVSWISLSSAILHLSVWLVRIVARTFRDDGFCKIMLGESHQSNLFFQLVSFFSRRECTSLSTLSRNCGEMSQALKSQDPLLLMKNCYWEKIR